MGGHSDLLVHSPLYCLVHQLNFCKCYYVIIGYRLFHHVIKYLFTNNITLGEIHGCARQYTRGCTRRSWVWGECMRSKASEYVREKLLRVHKSPLMGGC